MRTGRSQRLTLPTAFVAAVLIVIAGGRGLAAMLDQLFPEGVPAYDSGPGVTVRSRLRPDTEPPGMHVGSFVFRPELQSGVGYDSSPAGGSGSWLVRDQVSLRFAADWSRNALGGFLAADDTRYLDQPSQNRTDASAAVGGALEIGRDRLSLGIAHLALHEDRSRLDALPADRPIAFTLDNVRISYATNFDRWTLTPSLEASRWRFAQASVQDVPTAQRYRNRDVLQGGATLRYELAPLRSLVLLARATGQHYPDTPGGQASADSTGYQVLAGFDYDDDAMWRYRLLLGGEVRRFAAFAARAALIGEAEIAWQPTGLTTVRLSLSRSIEDAAQEGVAGFTYTAAKLTIDHEYLRDLLLSASVGLQQAAYPNGAAQDGATFGVSATWLMSRRVRVSATYQLAAYGDARGSAPTGTHLPTRSLAMLAMRLGL
jgi:hypothetical protein